MAVLLLILMLFANACATASGEDRQPPRDPAQNTPVFQAGQIWDVRTGRVVTFDDLLAAIHSADVVYLGEEHHNARHIDAALRVLRGLHAAGRRPTLGLEMFGWEAQPALDRYGAEPDWPRDEFLKAAGWEQNWGGAFADYEPLLLHAREHRLPLVALNPPKALVRLVAKQGLATALTDPAMARWDMQAEPMVDDPAYKEMIVTPLRKCHGGLSDDAYQRMYDASMFRDEGMAKVVANAVRRLSSKPETGAGPVVSYTGNGHINYRLPVPKRVARRTDGAARQVTIALASFDPSRAEEIQTLLADGVADYLWLTPLGPHGAPKRC